MKKYQKPDGSLWAFELDGSQDSLITSDMVLLSDVEFDAIVNPPPAPPTPAQVQAALEAAVQQRLDAFARSINFDNLASACLTGMQPVGTYRQAEGAELITLRHTTWQKAAEIRDAFFAGERPEPTWEEVEAELPGYPITE